MKSFLTWSIFAKMNIIFILVFISIATNFLVIKHFRDKKFKQDRVIDIAGRNRMLSQRIAFLSEMIVQKKHVIKQDLADAIELKDKSLQTLLIGGVPPGRDSTIVFKAASDEVAAKIMEVQDIWKPFKTHALTILTNTDRDLSTAITYIENNQKILLTANNDLVLFIEHEHRKLNNKIRYILLPLFFISVLIIIGGVLIIRKYVILPIAYLSEVASSMSRGHLETINFNKGKDEIGVLGKSLRKMTAVLRTTMLDIKSAAKQINEASSRMTENSILIAEGAEQEADASLIITDHVKTLSKVTKESTTKAYRTKDITAISLEKVNEGSKAFAQTMSAMKNIDKQILIVKDIAKQIDILAVNAAIEAARAGEAGRGFSVVASEVRKLADISKEASERIITITKEGVTLAHVSQDLLHEIVPQIEESTQLVSEIATENTALSNQITEILSAIQELSNISVQNSAFSQSIAEISEQLTQHSQQLHDTTEFFKVYKSEKN